MLDRDRQIDELHHELVMLKTALEFIHDPPAQHRIFARINTCIVEYTRLVEGRQFAVPDKPTERRAREKKRPFTTDNSCVRNTES